MKEKQITVSVRERRKMAKAIREDKAAVQKDIGTFYVDRHNRIEFRPLMSFRRECGMTVSYNKKAGKISS